MSRIPDMIFHPLLYGPHETGEVHEAKIVYTPGLGGSEFELQARDLHTHTRTRAYTLTLEAALRAHACTRIPEL